MTRERPIDVMEAINSQVTSDPIPKEDRLKSPKTVSLRKATTNPGMVSRSSGREIDLLCRQPCYRLNWHSVAATGDLLKVS